MCRGGVAVLVELGAIAVIRWCMRWLLRSPLQQ
jgi:hypothetical protein